jgi:Leucine-rich repeat (LRR) protein
MTTSNAPPAATHPKLRWYQWRLRSLFLLTLLVAIGMSWLTVTIQGQRRQKAAAEEITKAGGWAKSEPTWLGKLLRDDSLVRVTEVNLFWASTTDAELVYLQGLSQLQELWLNSNRVTDAGLVHLQGLRQLKHLSLNNSKVTDAGLVYLQGLTKLQNLVLEQTPITDAGLVHLHGLSQLHSLYLSGTKVTDQGVKKLQQALPNCQIQR